MIIGCKPVMIVCEGRVGVITCLVRPSIYGFLINIMRYLNKIVQIRRNIRTTRPKASFSACELSIRMDSSSSIVFFKHDTGKQTIASIWPHFRSIGFTGKHAFTDGIKLLRELYRFHRRSRNDTEGNQPSIAVSCRQGLQQRLHEPRAKKAHKNSRWCFFLKIWYHSFEKLRLAGHSIPFGSQVQWDSSNSHSMDMWCRHPSLLIYPDGLLDHNSYFSSLSVLGSSTSIII